MRAWLGRLFRGRFWALAVKELRQIRRDRRLVISLIVPPTLQVLLFGFALDADVQGLKLGVVDESRTPESRELISVLTENRTFRLAGAYATPDALGRALGTGQLDVGVVVPYDYAKLRARGRPATVQVLLNAVNANTAQIAEGYVEGAVAWLNRRIASEAGPGGRAAGGLAGAGGSVGGDGPAFPDGALGGRVPARADGAVGGGSRDPGAGFRAETARIELRTAFLYNPGLVNAWFIVTGVFGTLIILNGSLVAAATMIREKEQGTVEQLLMTPASALEIVAAKIVPLFVLLMGMVGIVLVVARTIFHVPFRGSGLLVLTACACCVLTGIGIGTFTSTLARTANQTQLIGFFVNPPLAVLSGALTPIEAMPGWVQPWTWVNPIAHFAIISRSVLVKGAGIDVVYPHLLALGGAAVLLVAVSAWRFRRQLA
jgi:ABC-2 type transport system permease protein